LPQTVQVRFCSPSAVSVAALVVTQSPGVCAAGVIASPHAAHLSEQA
jgi:hypothetical protein